MKAKLEAIDPKLKTPPQQSQAVRMEYIPDKRAKIRQVIRLNNIK